MAENIYHAEDREDVYDNEINPLMAKIIEICYREGIPFVASFEYAPDNLCTSLYLPEGCTDWLTDARDVLFVQPRSTSTMITTTDKDGKITSMTAVVS